MVIMTLRLYLEDSYIRSFKAKVLHIDKCNEVFHVTLDKTAFYPVSGGQDHDTGIMRGLNGLFKVMCVEELEDGNIVHKGVLDGYIDVGSEVECSLDWDRRYKLMKMHTAAHIIIQSVKKYFNQNVNCVSASKSVNGGHLDFQAPIQRDMLSGIEEIANTIIRENRPILIHYMNFDEAERYISKFGESLDLYLRKHIVRGPIRIVEVKDWIAIPCGGTHVKFSGEIGGLKILKRESKGKGVVRIYYNVID